MSEQPKQSEPKLSRTDFESMTHEQLAAMLESAEMTSAAHLSSKLSDAAWTIKNIGEDLMKHVKDLEWQGKAGDAFRDWGGHTASATLRLSQYAGAASQWMATVSEAINAAKRSMPDLAETTEAKAALGDAHRTIDAAKLPGARNDPDARKAAETARSHADTAQSRIDAVRQEAIQQMQRLAGTYEYSAMQINSVTPPTFAPAAGRAGPGDWWVNDQGHLSGPTEYVGGGSSGAASPAAASKGGMRSAALPHISTGPVVGPAPGHSSSPASVRPEPVSLNIDNADTLPRTSVPPLTAPSAGPALPPREVSPTGLPTGLPPTFTGGGRTPGATLPVRAPGIGRLPQMPGLAKPIEGMPRTPRETGIVGGRPVNATGRPANGIPRGTVIGSENGQGRTPLGRAISPGSAQGARSAGGMGSGRRLAAETGGVPGGRAGQLGRSGGRPFTSGGSGLVRPVKGAEQAQGSQVGRTGAAGRSADSRKSQEQHDKRPDYLVEDEETWTRDGRRTLPPVVD